MREPLSRHDGVLSDARAHPGSALLAAARRGAPGLRSALFDGRVGLLPILRVMHAVVALRPHLCDAFVARLGPLAGRFGELA